MVLALSRPGEVGRPRLGLVALGMYGGSEGWFQCQILPGLDVLEPSNSGLRGSLLAHTALSPCPEFRGWALTLFSSTLGSLAPHSGEQLDRGGAGPEREEGKKTAWAWHRTHGLGSQGLDALAGGHQRRQLDRT